MHLTSRISIVATLVLTACLSFMDQNVYGQVPPVQAGQVIISEVRLRGPAGAEDEFIEIYNNTDQPMVVQAVDQSAGWSIALSDGQITGPVCHSKWNNYPDTWPSALHKPQ